jgi:large subunit ribosomal protein L30
MAMSERKIRIKWIKSGINRKDEHCRTLRALGFTKLNQTREHKVTPQLEGMLRQVGYLCSVEEVK